MDNFERIFDYIDKSFHSALGAAQETEWEALPERAYNEFLVVVDRLTQHGTLPFFSLPNGETLPVAPPAKRPAPSRSLIFRDPRDTIRRHPITFGLMLTSAIGLYCYWRPPRFFLRLPILNRIPQAKKAPQRPRGLADGTRLDAVLVLGAERGGLGREMAVDLERRGFVILATVSDAGEIDALERLGRGHIKALLLDPADASTIPPFLRSLSTSLSLRFPLHAPDDPFRAAHQSPNLCAVINGLALANHCSTSHSAALLGPLEATALSALSDLVQKRVLTSLGVLQGTLPLLRTSPGQSSVVTLVPASTSRVALPYVGPQSIVNGALTAMNDVLRREVDSSKVSVSTIDVGFFERSHHGSARHTAGLGSSALELPPHLRSIYSPRGSGSPSSRQRSDVRKLTNKVYRTIISGYKGRQGVGAGHFTYKVASVLPTSWLDALLALKQRLSPPAVTLPTEASGDRSMVASRRPLPTPPSGDSSSVEMSYIQVKGQVSSESEPENEDMSRSGAAEVA